MITFKELEWSNAFSFGSNNRFDFSQNQITQFVGKNGHGKTSIILVLEEVLYNKNSKGISRSGILNRYTKDRFYTIKLTFDKDLDQYIVETRRTTSTQTVKLIKNGEDISSHTATATFKHIESILGMDHKTFTQIVNQRNVSNLKFLVATDTERKKFLIELLALSQYSQGLEHFKAKTKEVERNHTSLTATLNTLESQLQRLKNSVVTYIPLVVVPELIDNSKDILALKERINAVSSKNREILQNNKYKELLAGITLGPPIDKPATKVSDLTTKIALEEKTQADVLAFVRKMNTLGSKCATCLSEIDANKIRELLDPKEQELTLSRAAVANLKTEVQKLQNSWSVYQKYVNDKREYEEYHALYNPLLPTEVENATELQAQVDILTSLSSKRNAEIAKATEHNNKANINNAKIDAIEGQIAEIEAELPEHRKKLAEAQDLLAKYQILLKVFGNSGLVAYKIECLVQDLEKLTNEYLTDLSDGRFQIYFELSSSDKLDVVVHDSGTAVEIGALSNGEAARVNTAALLGIRKLLQILSNNKVNLLFLDETIDSLDDDGKEKLVEVLLKENHLNTVLVSHGFQHPLIEKVRVIKTNKISRIENG